jgi:tRNA(Ser,Leu) C12 N-acetylase TAN1
VVTQKASRRGFQVERSGAGESLEIRQWNILATSLEGRRDALLVALRRLGKFWRAGYQNVLVGRVENRQEFLEEVRSRLSTDMLMETSLTKIIPIERIARFDSANLIETLMDMLLPWAEQLAGGSFHVRLERRGLKGIVHTPTVEREVGAALISRADEHGGTTRVCFRDPDVVVAIETTGNVVGVGLLTREMRVAFPFVRVS